ncbi:cell division protein FtsQ/DivIB [Dongshaea marina]|uniref:cell division protein FtsQ/DivIB n=1 Tax=Dongshaea marina TaxID=2047966 RepID=UPI000D3E1873|nr:cell division protein FtsQ/DivIB [Dongshaea marina]
MGRAAIIRKQFQIPGRMRFWSGLLFFVVVLILVLWGGRQVKDWLYDGSRLPLNKFVVQGAQRPIVRAEIEAVLQGLPKTTSFFELNVDKLQQQLAAQPWVYQVAVRKQWPERLGVYVTEQQVMAHWGEQQLINRYGEIFSAPTQGVKLPDLWLSGRADEADKVVAMYHQLQPLFQSGPFRLTHLTMTGRGAWIVELDNGWKLYVGQQRVMERLQRFLSVYPQIQPQQQIAYLDLRYDTGIAVGWKNNKKVS